jgi:hyperosmotically inducible periplasmic protein
MIRHLDKLRPVARIPRSISRNDAFASSETTNNPIVKTSLSTLLALVCLCGSAALFQGCAGTATQQSTGEYVDDKAITAKVKAEFVRDELVKALDVNVDTFKGVVQLSGFVDTQAQKERAAQIAATVNGVREVKNNVTVK